MININKMLTTKNCYIGKNKPKYIVIHETDNTSKGAGAKRHAQAMNNGNLKGTVHYYVDDVSIYQTLDHKNGAYAIGDNGNKVTASKYGIHNQNSINIEICVNPDSNYNKAVDNAIDLVRYLMRLEGISINNVVRHYDATRKHCPRKILDNETWVNFKSKCNKTEESINKNYCILYSNEADKVGAEIISWGIPNSKVLNLSKYKGGYWGVICVGGKTEAELKAKYPNINFTVVKGSDRYDTIRKVLEHSKKY